ncbi:hypothetical protein N7470_009334 [Penicillium chermesinum]|nr:hypothetical protein N7470_009334 [Penicillium chermesinum]
MPLDEATVNKLRGIVDASCQDKVSGIPGVTVVAVDKDGHELFAHSAGNQGISSSEPMTLDNIFWIASCTKMLTALACMQLVEQGRLDLDDGDALETLLPELKELQVLREDRTFEKKKRAITLRMLLTHTSGCGYSFFNERLRDWGFPVGIDEFSGRFEDIKLPLLFQPGEGWEYGVGIDWAGLAVERVSGMSLNDYLTTKVFEPLGIKDMSMIPTADMRKRLAHMHAREKDNKLRPRDHIQRAPLVVDLNDEAAKKKIFNSGGAGMFAKPQEYCKVIAVLLGVANVPGRASQLLSKVDTRREARSDEPNPGIVSDPWNEPQGWGLSFMLSNGGATGRSVETVFWAGLANLWWWCDRQKGIGGIVCTQILPFADAQVLGLWGTVEAELYKALG